MKQPTLADLYFDDEFINTAGVVQGLMSGAKDGDQSYVIDKHNDGTESVYYTTESGSRYFLGVRNPEDIQLAAGPSPVVSDAGAAFGVYPSMGKRTQKSDIGEKMILGAPDFAAGVARGGVSAGLGLGGDIQKLGRFIGALASDNEGGTFTDKLGRAAAAMEGKTLFPSTEDVSKHGYTIPGTSITIPPLAPAVPAGTSSFGLTPEERQKSAEAGQFTGELVGDPFMLVRGASLAGKGIAKGAEYLGPKAAEMAQQGIEKVMEPMMPRVVGKDQTFPKVAGGIKFSEEETSNLLRLKIQREEKAKLGKEMPGAPKNERTVIPAPEGSGLPDFVVGKITPEDWTSRVEKVLSPEEIQKSARWYDEIRDTFLKYTGGDEAKTDKYMRAWLVANQNIGVDGAFNNVLLQAEQFARKVPEAEMKAGGLPMPTQAARMALTDQPITEGVGFKISDFVDSAEGKSVRSILGNDERGGAPFVVDIHTARDMGLVDNILLNHLERQGYAVDKNAIKTDLGTGPTDTQYENRADFGRQLTEHLNSIGWQGKSDWKPREVQAVGWMSMTRLTADAAPNTVTALERNLRRISMELAPGEGSPWAEKYGAAFVALPPQRQAEITNIMTDRAMEMAREISGVDLRNMVHGTGGWETFQNPAAVAQTLATRSGAEIAANTLGYLLQQTEVWVNSIKGTTKSPKALAVDFIESGSDNLSTNSGLRDFWAKIMAADPTKLFVGYQPIRTADGEVGIRVLIDKGGEKALRDVQDALASGGSIEAVLTKLDYNIRASGYEADLVKARNDWKEFKDGNLYLARLADLGVRRTAADFNPLRIELEKQLQRELSNTGTGPGPGTGGAATAATKTGTTARKKVKQQPSSGSAE